jgi:hypothetical protein
MMKSSSSRAVTPLPGCHSPPLDRVEGEPSQYLAERDPAETESVESNTSLAESRRELHLT